MKKFLPAFALWVSFSGPSFGQLAPSSSPKNGLTEVDFSAQTASFKKIADRYRAFFAEPRLHTLAENFEQSPTKVVISVIEKTGRDLTYDVIKTDSLVYPLIGYVQVAHTTRRSQACGDYKITETERYWTTSSRLIKEYKNSKCYGTTMSPKPGLVSLYEYAYTEGAWRFRRVLKTMSHLPSAEKLTKNFVDSELSTTLGLAPQTNVVYLSDAISTEFNRPWKELVLGK